MIETHTPIVFQDWTLDEGGRVTLPIAPELRVVLQLTVLDGLSTREAAVLLGIPRGTVKTRLQRARAKMREEMA